MQIRKATSSEHDAVWRVLEPVIRSGETYDLPRDMARSDALACWFAPDNEVFVCEIDQAVAGSYYLRPNSAGGETHVANAAFATSVEQGGIGVGRKMCEHALARAAERGFPAMQFNFVVSSNERAIRLWRSLGFEIVGRLPGAFAHPSLGDIDALVMVRDLPLAAVDHHA